VSSRRDLLPAGPGDSADLRALELKLLRAELLEAEARFETTKAEVGNVVVLAACDGLVDELLVQVGSAVEPNAPLVRYYDPDSLKVTAYAEASESHWLREGASCLVVAEAEQGEYRGTVRWAGAAWVSCPPQLATAAGGRVDMRVPVVVRCPDGRKLRPNTRVRIEIPRRAAEKVSVGS
jgi:multidrug resistance efflux pump